MYVLNNMTTGSCLGKMKEINIIVNKTTKNNSISSHAKTTVVLLSRV